MKHSYQREILAYHGLPIASVLVLVAVFKAVYFLEWKLSVRKHDRRASLRAYFVAMDFGWTRS
jgi:hypothetical protein